MGAIVGAIVGWHRRCAVLSDHERASWDEIKDQLKAEDPRFARVFDARARRRAPSRLVTLAVGKKAYRIQLWTTASLAVLLLIPQHPGLSTTAHDS